MEQPQQVRFYQVDAFTDRPFRGIPTGVFLWADRLDPDAMQLLSRELGLSESAFVGPPGEDGAREIRWFTPAVEVTLSGHATLAAGHVLSTEMGEPTPIRFASAWDRPEVEVAEGVLSMDVPADPPAIALPPSGLLKALGVMNAVPVLRAEQVWVVRLGTRRDVEVLTPNISALLDVDPGEGVVGVAVTAPGGDEVDFVSRFFAPWVGVPEHPVTGVAHTVLAPYWANQMARETVTSRQMSARGGKVTVRVAGDRVILSGRAVTVAHGEFRVPSRTS